MINELPSIESLMASLQLMGMPGGDLASIAAENPSLVRKLKRLDRNELLSRVAGMLLLPELQSNCLRLETLAHLAVVHCGGQKRPLLDDVASAFKTLGEGHCGRMEDPAEDVFVTSVATSRGNFRVLEGLWESAGFYTQRFFNLIEGMPAVEPFDGLRRSAFALLTLSDAACGRADLERWQLGEAIPQLTLPSSVRAKLHQAKSFAQFSDAELEELGISQADLEPFLFRTGDRSALPDEWIGHSSFERRPLVSNDGGILFALPTAASVAIRRLVIEFVRDHERTEIFLGLLAGEYERLLRSTPLLGGKMGAPISFQRSPHGFVAGVMQSIDAGLYLNLVFFLDTLEQFEETGFRRAAPSPELIASDVEKWALHAQSEAEKQPDFRSGITLVVGCGVGRGAVALVPKNTDPRWRFEFAGAPDLVTLSWALGMKPLDFWRVIETREKIEQQGVRLQNVNGLLNLFAWARSLNGHLVPHGSFPDNFLASGHGFMSIEQNILRDLRHEVAASWDCHVEPFVDGRMISVRKEAQSIFEEDKCLPSYASDGERGASIGPMGLFITETRRWWFDLIIGPNRPVEYAPERWKTLSVWMARAAPVLDELLAPTGHPVVHWEIAFEGELLSGSVPTEPPTPEALLEAFETEADKAASIIRTKVGQAFEAAFFSPENIAERALVGSLVDGVAALAGIDLASTARENLVNRIVPDVWARQQHAFYTRSYNDYVRDSLPDHPLLISDYDDGWIKLGLGARVGSGREGRWIDGMQACTAYLNDIVKLLSSDVAEELRQLDRRSTITHLLRNHEAAVAEREQWRRTSAAVLALRTDKVAARRKIAENEFELNGVFLTTRMLAEMALSECPLEGGRKPGKLDLSRLMARASYLFSMGGWSDAIRWGAMEPRLHITALGDIHARQELSELMEPFAQRNSDVRIDDAIESYAENLKDLRATPSIKDAVEPDFWIAWEAELDATLDEFRVFVDVVERLGLKSMKAVVSLRKSELLGEQLDGLSASAAEKIIEALSQGARPTWADVPEGFVAKDLQPWRFRRRLSILQRPLLQIDNESDPTFIVAPGVVREALGYTVRGYLNGDFPDWQLGKLMKRWAGRQSDQRGRRFAEAVASRMQSAGWNTEVDIKITKIIKKATERDFGDVDVLAWHPHDERIFIIECKDVQYKKTYGEIAEQLSDFRGQLRDDGKPDYLLRHLDRVDFLNCEIDSVQSFVGVATARKLESVLLFKNPVPMEFALRSMASKVSVGVFDRFEAPPPGEPARPRKT